MGHRPRDPSMPAQAPPKVKSECFRKPDAGRWRAPEAGGLMEPMTWIARLTPGRRAVRTLWDQSRCKSGEVRIRNPGPAARGQTLALGQKRHQTGLHLTLDALCVH